MAQQQLWYQEGILGALRRPRPVSTIGEVVAVMDAIGAVLERRRNGIYWFNLLYRNVTVAVGQWCKSGACPEPAWLEAMDAIFAEEYFRSLQLHLEGSPETPEAWLPLYAAADDPAMSPLFAALLGLNSHINYDLGRACAEACRRHRLPPWPGSRVHRTHLGVNRILLQVEVGTIRRWIGGRIKRASAYLQPLDSAAVMGAIAVAREAAWAAAMIHYAAAGSSAVAPTARRLERLSGAATHAAGNAIWRFRHLDDTPAVQQREAA